MTKLVTDTTPLVDLRKASALHLLTGLPYELMTTNLVFDELRDFSPDQIREITDRGLKVHALSPMLLGRSVGVFAANRHLSMADASVFALAQDSSGSILLTGDKHLRAFAQGHEIEVHGTIWLFHQFLRNNIGTKEELSSAVQKLIDDDAVRLPRPHLSALIEEIKARG